MPALVNVIVSLTSPALWAVVFPEPSVVVAAVILPESLPAFGTWTLTVILPLAASSEPVNPAAPVAIPWAPPLLAALPRSAAP